MGLSESGNSYNRSTQIWRGRYRRTHTHTLVELHPCVSMCLTNTTVRVSNIIENAQPQISVLVFTCLYSCMSDIYQTDVCLFTEPILWSPLLEQLPWENATK